MCGISLILSGVRIIGSDIFRDQSESSPPINQEVHEPDMLVDNLKASLGRRGPDNLGSRKIFLQSKYTNSVKKEDEEDKGENLCLQINDNEADCSIYSIEPPSTQGNHGTGIRADAEMELLGATLQLRGLSHAFQPLEDAYGNVLVYNGEIFGGIHVAGDCNDGHTLLDALGKCCSCGCHRLHLLERAGCCDENGLKSVPEILSTIKGPWALIYWQEKSKIIWFGRDAFGRRSLLVHWPTFDDSRFVLSSVSATSSVRRDLAHGADPEAVDMAHGYISWEELPCGIYSIQLEASLGREQCTREKIIGQVMKHAWTDSLLNRLIEWERTNVEPKEESSLHDPPLQKAELLSATNCSLMKCTASGCVQLAQKVLIALRESVMRRTAMNSILEVELQEITLPGKGGKKRKRTEKK